MKKTLIKALLAAAIGAGALGVTAGSANAYIVCNGEHDCWHTHERLRYPERGYVHHPDDWYFHNSWSGAGPYHWREYHEGRGYWRHGVWVTF